MICAGLGLAVGHISEETVGLITLVGLITIGLSTYLILYSNQIYELLAPALGVFQKKYPYRELSLEPGKEKQFDLIIFGIGRFGSRIAEMLEAYHHIKYLAVDFDPMVVKWWQQKSRPVIYGDLEDPEILDLIPYQDTKCIISTIPDRASSLHLIDKLKRHNYQGEIYVTVHHDRDVEVLKKGGANQVLLPHQLAAANFFNSLLSILSRDKIQSKISEEKL